MPEPQVTRHFNAIVLTGQQLEIVFTPTKYNTINIRVWSLQDLHRADRRARLGQFETRYGYPAAGITLSSTKLLCLVSDRLSSFLKEGIEIQLEPGMAPLIARWLPKLTLVAATTKQLDELLLDHAEFHEFAANVVARVILDHMSIENALISETALGTPGANNQVFLKHFTTPAIVAVLEANAGPF